MWRWIVGGAGFAAILGVGGLLVLFFTAKAPLAKELDVAESIVAEANNVQSIQEVDYYYGEDIVYNAFVTKNNKEKEWVFVQDQKILERVSTEDTISLEEAEKVVMKRFDLPRIRSIKIGYENAQAIYEVTFERDGRFHYYYMSMINGEFIKRYSMKQS